MLLKCSSTLVGRFCSPNPSSLPHILVLLLLLLYVIVLSLSLMLNVRMCCTCVLCVWCVSWCRRPIVIVSQEKNSILSAPHTHAHTHFLHMIWFEHMRRTLVRFVWRMSVSVCLHFRQSNNNACSTLYIICYIWYEFTYLCPSTASIRIIRYSTIYPDPWVPSNI